MMNPAQSRVRVEERDGVTCILFVDRNILDEDNIQQIGAEISEIVLTLLTHQSIKTWCMC